jgi:predicted RNA polymerase sigma factor
VPWPGESTARSIWSTGSCGIQSSVQVQAALRDPAQSEEITHEALLELWRTAVRYDSDKCSATAWVLTIARRYAIDRLRCTATSTCP